MTGRSVTILVQRDGATATRTYRVRLAMLRLGVILGAVMVVGGIALAILYAPIMRMAARVPGLERELARLQGENAKVRELSAAVDSLEQRYAQVRAMIGADIVRDPVVTSALQVAPPVHARVSPIAAGRDSTTIANPSLPTHWPLDETGYITRGQVGTGERDEAHPGIDVAIPMGSPVRAAGGGTVRQAGEDPEYGLFVLLDHPDQYQTMYGHLSRIITTAGAVVAEGEVIGLSGNTGRSTAPHLHFEVRRGGLSLDPLTMVKEGR